MQGLRVLVLYGGWQGALLAVQMLTKTTTYINQPLNTGTDPVAHERSQK
jgi:hypothetical protein